jgi:cytochrome c-type biogenesis protein CcmH/NrfG
MMKKLFLMTCCVVLASTAVAFGQSDLQKAQTLFKQKEYPAALPLAQAAVKAAPKDVNGLLLLGDIYDALDQSDSSLAYYLKAQDQDYYKPEVMRKVAFGLSNAEKHTDALKKAQEIVKNYPKDPQSYLALAQVYINGNEKPGIDKNALTLADANIIKAQGINKELVEAYVTRGDLYFAQRVFALARDNYEEALKRDPNLLDPTMKLAQSYFRLANEQGTSKEENISYINKTLETYSKATKLDSNNAKAFYESGRILFLARQYKPSAAALTRYAQLKPDGYLGRWYLAQSQFNILKAEKVLDTALIQSLDVVSRNIDSVRDQSNIMLAEVLLLNRDFVKSAAKYAEIKANKGLDENGLTNYARACINGGDTTTAVTLYREYFGKYPKSSCKNALPIGNLVYNLRRYDVAIEILRVKTDTANCPKDEATVRALYFIGSSYFSQKEKGDSAIAPLQQALKYDSTALYARNLLARVLLDQKKDKQAKEEWLKVAEIGKGMLPKSKNDMTSAYQDLCNVALKGKNFSELQKYAQGWYNMYAAGDNDPNKGYACLFLAISYYQSDPAQACKYYKEVLQYLPTNKDAKIQIEQLGCDSMSKPKDDKKKKK